MFSWTDSKRAEVETRSNPTPGNSRSGLTQETVSDMAAAPADGYDNQHNTGERRAEDANRRGGPPTDRRSGISFGDVGDLELEIVWVSEENCKVAIRVARLTPIVDRWVEHLRAGRQHRLVDAMHGFAGFRVKCQMVWPRLIAIIFAVAALRSRRTHFYTEGRAVGLLDPPRRPLRAIAGPLGSGNLPTPVAQCSKEGVVKGNRSVGVTGRDIDVTQASRDRHDVQRTTISARAPGPKPESARIEPDRERRRRIAARFEQPIQQRGHSNDRLIFVEKLLQD